MVRDSNVSAGRPAAASSRPHTPTRLSKENINPSQKTPTIDAPGTATTSSFSNGAMLSASSSNNHSLFSFGSNGAQGHDDAGDSTTTSFDFLPSVSFDDLQSSLESASTEFKLTQFPSPNGQGSILNEKPSADNMAGQHTSTMPTASSTRKAVQPNPTPNTATTGVRTTRSGSILRRPSLSSRQPSIGSNSTMSTSVMDAPTAPAAMRNRRQSHYPPVSGSTIGGKPPRKSIGPGVIESDFGTRTAPKRRPSLISTSTEKDAIRASLDFNSNIGAAPAGDPSKSLIAPRAGKTKSMQPPTRITGNLAVTNSSSNSALTLTPDGNRKSIVFPRSPKAGGGGGGGSTPGSAKRVSVMPGHLSGLGARTISPTDAQRMKRMSMHQSSMNQSQSMPQVASVQATTNETRATSRSPSMIPRKTSTPSSSRTTPDMNRKSYSSGLSVNSTTSFNTHRTSTGSIQQRAAAQNNANSRLPAPKALTINSNAPPAEDDEDVPPVPAIPKAYESPKDAPSELSFLDKRKSNYAFDTSSINSSSTGTLSNAPSFDTVGPGPNQHTSNTRKQPRKAGGGASSDIETKVTPTQQKKSLAPLRLPPINLGPLSTPTATKIAALKEPSNDAAKMSPPPERMIPKTPTTPMTASKSSFFSRRAEKDAEKATIRSISSTNHITLDSPVVSGATSSSESLMEPATIKASRQPAISPYLSSSVPKVSGDFGAELARAKANADANKPAAMDAVSEAKPQQKPSGPRAQKVSKPASKSPTAPASPEEPPTPSSMSSLRRKLSLSWKRSTSKSSNHPSNATGENAASHARQDSMPPPRIPISATLGSMKASSPSHATKPSGSYLDTRRRKSSASSLTTIMTQEKSRGDWANAKKSLETGNNSLVETSSTSRTSTVQRMLRPRPSVATIKHSNDPYTAELDKDDLVAEDEMKKLASRRKETELAARTLDALRKRATPKERVSSHEAIRIAMLNIYERGEIVDYNDVYFCGTQNAAKVVGDLKSSAPNFGYDDERGDYSIVVGDHLSYRYEIVDVLGKGSFGQVVRCIDHKTGVLVAVKIIRNKKRFHQQALVEVNILQKLREWDSKNRHSMVNFTHSFYFRGHLCISTELLDMNLYEFIKSNAFRGFSLKLIRRFTKQMLSSLNLLKQHKVIHCDLKPENILLRHPMHSEIKVIDFGSSCFENEKVYTYIQSRFYRSPEVILGMTYGLPIDMWSLGCILAELYTGVPIFPGENEQEQLACIMEVFGPPEKHLIEKSTRKKLFFDSMGKPRLTVSSKGRRRRPSSKTLQQALKCDDEPFLDFLARCLRWDPDRRIKPEEAVRHEFITGLKPSTMAFARVRENTASPIKRHNTVASARPLPDPPASTRTVPPMRAREATAASPNKQVPAGPRRASGINGPFNSAGVKRTSGGQTTGGSTATAVGSSLPRVAGRVVSGSKDLASAGANAAMNRRA
ncbi:Dual specificity protein kinase pom1 [Apiospora arundinis]|uniref:Dual specificity protein kinase pom1 n=1 Tax=Apiospora arundinis TaxID=335852 RepID=A0ABR2IHC6_9PEZI